MCQVAVRVKQVTTCAGRNCERRDRHDRRPPQALPGPAGPGRIFSSLRQVRLDLRTTEPGPGTRTGGASRVRGGGPLLRPEGL